MPPKKRQAKQLDVAVQEADTTKAVENLPPKTKKNKKNEIEKDIEVQEDAKGKDMKVKNTDETEIQNGVMEADKTKSKGRPTRKPKEAPKEKEGKEALETKHIVTKRGAQLKSADYEEDDKSEEEPIKKRTKAKNETVKTNDTQKKGPKETKSEEDVASSKTRAGRKLETETDGKAPSKKKDKVVPKDEKVDDKKEKNSVKKDVSEKKGKANDKKDKPVDKKGTTKKIAEKKEKELPKTTKAKEDKSTNEIGEVSDLKNNTVTDWQSIDFKCEKTNSEGESYNLKVTSWNVDGLKAWIKKEGLNILEYDSPDILCLQETKCADDKLPVEITNIEGYHKYWCSSNKNGYAGVGLLSKKLPINVVNGIGNEEQDDEGRCITAEYEKFYLVSVYVPNAGRRLVTLDKRLDWNSAFKQFIEELDKKKPVIICGDLNVAHNEIDLKNPKTNTKNAGFTKEEREGMTDFLGAGYIDTFRALYPDEKDVYTFWTYMMNSRKKNVGWRLDYFLVSERLEKKICDSVVYDQVFGSDHCPIGLFINI